MSALSPVPQRSWLTNNGTQQPPGTVRIRCDDPAMNLLCLLGDEPPQITGGFGGWEITNRPRQVAMTTWEGVEPFQVTLSIMLEGFSLEPQRSVEPLVRALIAVARGDGESPPGLVTVSGVPLPVEDWFIEEMSFGDAILRPSDGSRVRLPVVLTLREYVPPTYVSLAPGWEKREKSKTKVVKVKKGDTPTKIAKRYRCKFSDLRSLNPKIVKKSEQKLTAGTKLRVPLRETTRRTRSTKAGSKGSSR